MRVCLIANTPSLAMALMPHIRERHPDLEPRGFVFAQVHRYLHVNSDFRLPRGLAWRDYPFAGAPRYDPFNFGWELYGTWNEGLHFGAADKVVAEGEPEPGMPWGHDPVAGSPPAEARRRFARADVIYAAMNPLPPDYLALDRCLRYLDLSPDVEVRMPLITDTWPETIARALDAPDRPGDDRYLDMLRRARIRRRFDYGYLVNSLAVHGRALREAGAGPDAPVPSKYGLQLLYDLRLYGPASEARLHARVRDWRGTGRYRSPPGGRNPALGGGASWPLLLDMLSGAGLMDRSDAKYLRLTGMGHRFLDLLHPGSEDRDLPARLREWQTLPEHVGDARVDRYLRTFFGRQIRFAARRGVFV